MKNSSPKNNGFTLLEVIISLTIISIVIAGMYGLSMNSIKTNKYSEIKQQETTLGQDVFEDFRSNDVSKIKTSDSIKLSNGMELKFDKNPKDANKQCFFVNDYDLGDGYLADIEMTQNTSQLGSGQPTIGNKSEFTHNYFVDFKKVGLNYASIKNHDDAKWSDNTSIASDETTKLYVTVDSDGTDKKIKVKIDGGPEVDSNTLFDGVGKDADLVLWIDCSEYNISEGDEDNDKGFEVHVINHDIRPINICLVKTNSIFASAFAEAGKYQLYNNRSYDQPISQGDLYDIKVAVRQTKYNDKQDIFTGEISQNLKLIDQTNK